MKRKTIKLFTFISVLILLLPQNVTFAQSIKEDESIVTEGDLSKEVFSDEENGTDETIDEKEPNEDEGLTTPDKSEDGYQEETRESIQKETSSESTKEDESTEGDSSNESKENNKPKIKVQQHSEKSNVPKFTIGDEGDHVRELKEKLTELGFGNFPTKPSSVYGKVTANVVRDFQKTFGLKVTGEANPNTLSEIDKAFSSNYRNGKSSPQIRELKIKLTQLGFGNFPRNPSKKYGSVTAKVIKEFQAKHGLLETGIADSKTRNKIDEILEDSFEDGDRGQHVVQLKKDLTELGFGHFPRNPSKNYGKVTANVVKDFQKTFGLKVTGEADTATLNAIATALSSNYRDGKSGSHISELKQKLTQLGFGRFPANPSSNYGKVTANVVKEFQRHYKLTATGIADDKTLSKIEEILQPPYKNGHQGLHISQLKKDLREIGFGSFPANPSITYGSVTAKVVEDFQKTYNLKVTGIVNRETLSELNKILSSDYRSGKKGAHVRELKKDLTQLGFGNFPRNPSTSYGSTTVNVVREFQSQYGLQPTGIADEATRNKIKEILNPPYKEGHQGLHISQLKKDLRELGFGNFPANPSITYGSVTVRVVKEFQETYNLNATGNADRSTLQKISELKKGLNYVKYDYSLKEAVEIQMNRSPQTDNKKYAWVSKNYIDSNNRVTASALNVRTQPTTETSKENIIIGTLDKGTLVDIIDEKGNWYAIKYINNSWVHAVREDLRYYLDPNNFINDSKGKFQFLDLSKPSGVTRSTLNNYLSDKGILRGQGQAFIDAARVHRVNDVYLLSHALLETGNGTSTLSTGVEVGLNRSGNPVLVTNNNRKSLTQIKKVYNMYGIGAVDSDPLRGGAIHAYKQEWFTVADSIIGGAAFIGNSYIKNGQNTLYKMRWNPLMNEGMAWKQYATDIGWASKQVYTMYNLYKEIGFDNPVLDIPAYKQ